MKEVIKILMFRDNMTYEEAKDLCLHVRGLMEECNYDPEECEDIFMEEIGLEPDYIPMFLVF